VDVVGLIDPNEPEAWRAGVRASRFAASII
jgi:hypothetical protein